MQKSKYDEQNFQKIETYSSIFTYEIATKEIGLRVIKDQIALV